MLVIWMNAWVWDLWERLDLSLENEDDDPEWGGCGVAH